MYYMFLDDMQIPIPPPEMRTKIRNKNRTVDLLSAGEINILKDPGLTEIEFKVLLPNQTYPFNQSLLGNSIKAQTYIDKLATLKAADTHFQFIMVRMTDGGEILNIENLKMSLEDYTLDESAQDGYDFQADLHLKQWKEHTTKTITTSTDSKGTMTGTTAATRETTKIAAATVMAKSGDTLQTLIKKNFGSVSSVAGALNSISFIQNLNKITIPGVLAAGQIIKMKSEGTT